MGTCAASSVHKCRYLGQWGVFRTAFRERLRTRPWPDSTQTRVGSVIWKAYVRQNCDARFSGKWCNWRGSIAA